MFNIVIYGTPVDINNIPIDVYFKVDFLYKEFITEVLQSELNQVVINVNDTNVLGYNGYLETNEPIILIIWQGSLDKSTIVASGRKRISHTGPVISLGNIKLYSNFTLEHTVTVEKETNVLNITNNTVTNRPVVEYTYYIYGYIDSIVSDHTANTNYKLLKTIRTINSRISLTFSKTGKYKIISETLVDNLDVSEQQIDIIDIQACNAVIDVGNIINYVEWE